jgi:RNA polymerase sigma factor (sigma-70 family)
MDVTDGVDVLVAAARDGDSEAWDALVERYLPLVTAIISRHRLTGADADDVNQSVWLRLVEHLSDLREPAALPGWIATTTRNESLRTLRGRSRALPVDPLGQSPFERAADGPDVDDALLRDERYQALREALLGLPQPRRALLELVCADPPVPYDEISRRLGIPVGSIGPTRARALAQLRRSPALSALATVGAATGGRR